MKLCRFELKASPGQARSGMVYGGKIYETEGGQAAGVHEAVDVRPLAPVERPGSIRLFRNDLLSDVEDAEGLQFLYSNPACMVGPSQIVNYPAFTGDMAVEPYLAAVIVGHGYALDVAEADDIILGLTILSVLVDRAAERRQGRPGGRSHDVAIAFGPVLTTPDELDEAILDSENGRRHSLSVLVRINGEERAAGNAEDLAVTLAQAISFASQSCTLREGDVVAIGPLVDLDADLGVEPGDEIQVAVERLGTLATKINDLS